MPIAPPGVLGPDRGPAKTAEAVPPTPGAPALALGSGRGSPKFAEAVPPVSGAPESGPKPDPEVAKLAAPAPMLVSPADRRDRCQATPRLRASRSRPDLSLSPTWAAWRPRRDAGDPKSQTMLALAYHAGTLLKVNDEEALSLLRRAANRGFVAAEEAMGIFCQSGFGMPPTKRRRFTGTPRRRNTDHATRQPTLR